jgi:hypothetical protein
VFLRTKPPSSRQTPLDLAIKRAALSVQQNRRVYHRIISFMTEKICCLRSHETLLQVSLCGTEKQANTKSPGGPPCGCIGLLIYQTNSLMAGILWGLFCYFLVLLQGGGSCENWTGRRTRAKLVIACRSRDNNISIECIQRVNSSKVALEREHACVLT